MQTNHLHSSDIFHQEQSTKKYICPFDLCGRKYVRKSRLSSHIESYHMKNSDFTCNDCGKQFSDKGNLRLHSKLHSGTKPFNCRYCNSTFATPGNRLDHERRHKGEKPYSCSRCNDSFYRRYLLIRHQEKCHEH
mmetsp:Transcript_26588/g.19925  ORF Transcript_26588/g.19925 Transcript_26588/m.19925 type:complete len:134 (-) Transcript_26588:286-687(-)